MVYCYGFGALSFNVQPDDANLIKALKRHGAIPFIKTNMCCGGLSGETKNFMFGKVSSPLDFSRNAGGSSGGEGAIIALKCSPAGIGSDIAGSLRNPASACGIVALKPSTQRMPARAPHPKVGVPGNVTSWGPMARTVDDLELLMQAALDDISVHLDVEAVPMPWDHQAYLDDKP